MPQALASLAPPREVDATIPARRPFRATSATTLVHDVIGSSDLLVDSTTANQIALYRNPFAGDATEAAIVVNGGLSRLQRGADGRWELVPVVHEWLVGCRETVPLVDPLGKVWVFVATTAGLVMLALTPDGLEVKDGFTHPLENLRVAYSAAAPVRRVVAAGFTPSGALVAYPFYPGEGEFEENFLTLPRAFTGNVASLAMQTGGPPRVAGSFDGRFGWYDINLPAAPPFEPVVLPGEPKVAKVLGSYEEEPGQAAFVYLGIDDNVYVARTLASSPTVDPIPDVQARDGQLAIGDNGLITLYLLDGEGRLAVLRQTGWTAMPATQTTPTVFAPVWSTARDEQHRKSVPVTLGIATGVDGIALDPNPADRPTVVLLTDSTESTHAVSLLSQDPTTDAWRNDPIRLGATQAYQVSRFITRVALRDGDGLPLRHHYVTLHAESALEAEVGGQLYRLGTRHEPTTVQADLTGGLCIATAATGLTATPITLVAEGLAEAVTLRPDAQVQGYLAGTATLPFFTPFDGDTLHDAKIDGRPLIPSWGSLHPDQAVQLIRGTIALGDPNLPRPTAAALLMQTYDPSRPAFRELATRQEVQAELDRLRSHPDYGGFWDDVADFAHDVWEGVKSGAVKVVCTIANFADNAVHFAISVGGRLLELAQIAIHTLAEAFDAVAGIFNQLATKVKEVIEWLQSGLHLADVWDTKNAIRSGLDRLGPAIVPLIDAITGDTIEAFFAGASERVTAAFAAVTAKMGLQPISSLDFSGGEPPILVQAGERIVDAYLFVQAQVDAVVSWLWDKFIGQWLEKLAELLPSLNLPTLEAVNQAVDAVIAAFATVGSDVARIIEALANWAIAVAEGRDVDQATALRDTALRDLFAALQRAALDGVEVLHTIALQLVAVLEAVVLSLPALLDTPLDLGAFRLVYEWIQGLAGAPAAESKPPTVGDLVCLLAAFPATYIYKLFRRSASAQLFPGGVLPSASPAGDTDDDKEKGERCVIASLSIGLVGYLAGMMADFGHTTESVLLKPLPPGEAADATNLSAPGAAGVDLAKLVTNVLGAIAALLGVISTFLFWPSKNHIPFEDFEDDTLGQIAAITNWAITLANGGIDIALLLFTFFKTGRKNAWVKRADSPVGVTIDSVLGLTTVALGIVESVDEGEDFNQWLSNVLTPWPAALQFLRAPEDPRSWLTKFFVADAGGIVGMAFRVGFNPNREPGPSGAPA